MDRSPADQINEIVGRVVKGGIPACPMDESLHLARTCPESIKSLAISLMQQFPQGGTYFDATLGYVPEADWPQIVQAALEALEATHGENEAAEAVIAYTSLQSPSALHPHLSRIFELGANASTYYSGYPWRESGDLHFDYLRKLIENPETDEEDRMRAWQAMCQTRHVPIVEWAISHSGLLTLPYEHWTYDTWLQSRLGLVGFQQQENSLSRLCADILFHIQFPGDYFDPESRPSWQARLHPTWQLESTISASLGGGSEEDCSLCRSKLHRLLLLDPIPDGLGVSGLKSLKLATCLSCLGYEKAPLFYRHAPDGTLESTGYKGPRIEPQFPVGPLKECSVQLAATPKRWFWQDWALSNCRENLNRIGGEPCWIQDAEYPQCPSCDRVMHFLMQLDSDLPTEVGGEWLWGSGGIGYGFWCDDCKVSAFHWQCT